MHGLMWAENVWAEISDERELDGLLDRLERNAETEGPFVVELSLSGHGSLGMGVGADQSVITFVGDEPGAPRYVARGRRFVRAHPHAQTFRYRGDPDAFPAETAVDGDEARAAMKRFLRSGEVPKDVDWEHDEPDVV